MLVKVISGAFMGLDSYPVHVEVDVAPGLPCMEMIGCLSKEAGEAKDRIRVALKNMEINLPPSRITINLSPADRHKSGTGFDLPATVGLLCAIGKLDVRAVRDILFVGEMGLDGSIKPVRGILPIVAMARKNGVKTCVVPLENAAEAAVIEDMCVYGVHHLNQVLANFDGYHSMELKRELPGDFAESGIEEALDFAQICGAETIRRAVEVAAAGFHHMMMVGPPGSGKTMIASRIPGILPPLSKEESLESSAIYSISGQLPGGRILTKRPFVAPHHSSPGTALVGGGRIPMPGAASLAHHGVLFLDELTEFKRSVLDMMRQPMEEKKVRIQRVYGAMEYPADFMLVAATNPCPCGYYPDLKKCRCTDSEIRRYLSHISGPLLDRLDICVEVPKMRIEEFFEEKRAEKSADIRERIMRARAIQEERFAADGGTIRFNSAMNTDQLQAYCVLEKEEQETLKTLLVHLGLSARAYHKILRVSRTIADLDASKQIKTQHLQEAVFYRNAMKQYWGNRG